MVDYDEFWAMTRLIKDRVAEIEVSDHVTLGYESWMRQFSNNVEELSVLAEALRQAGATMANLGEALRRIDNV